jgi:GntR family transcriptional regulator, galactonate operon transcriptional repressor
MATQRRSNGTEATKQRRRHEDGGLFANRGLHNQVVNELGQRIVWNEFGATGLLPTEPNLAAELGVSRNVLREAVKVLVGKGLLEVRPKTGTRIQPRTEWNLLDRSVLDWHASSREKTRHSFDLVEFRLIVEPRASYLAAKRASRAERSAILEACTRLEDCVSHPNDIPATDIVFHNLIHRASQNPLLIYLGKLLGSLMSVQVRLTTEDLEQFKKGLPYHRKLAEAISQKDPERAEAMSTALVRMPYSDLAGRLRVKSAARL